jgi:hypothetical protein
MSSTAYHWSPRLVESEERSEIVDPWLEDKTTTPYRREAARSSNSQSNTKLKRRTQPGAAPVQPKAAPAQPSAASSPRLTIPPLPESTTTRAERTSTAQQPRAIATAGVAQGPRAPVSAVRHVTTMKLERVAKRVRQPKTMKLEPVRARPAMTPDQLSHVVLESFWRDQQRAVRARSARKVWIGVAICAAVLSAVMLRLFGPNLLPSIPWQRAPQIDLADLLMRQHAAASIPAQRSHSPAAPSGVRPEQVMVTAPESDALAQPATLQIDSQPWARVYVDEVLIGNTPQLAISLQPGTHTVRLQNPERGLRRDISFEAHTGETIHRVEQLEP